MKLSALTLAISTWLLSASLSNAHFHFAAGFLDENGNNKPDQGEPLRLVNPPSLDTVFQMSLVQTGPTLSGYYALTSASHDYFTFTALSDGQVEAADPRHAATGSYIWMEITSVVGPEGASFGFWEEGDPQPRQAFETNQPTGGFRFEISEPLVPNDPTEDPWGHIHGRVWTVTEPGDYYVTFTLYDMSTNGTDGGPIHSPSESYTFHFVAVPEPGTALLLGIAAAALGGTAVMRRRPRL